MEGLGYIHICLRRNITDEPRTFYLSLQEGVLGDEAGCVLETGDTRDDDGVHIETTTVMLLTVGMKSDVMCSGHPAHPS